MNTVNRWLDVPSLDPDDARRRKLLNILLFGALVSTILFQLAISVVDIVGAYPTEDISILQVSVVIALVSIAGLLIINRYWSGQLAGFLFLLFLVALATFFDEPAEVVDGRTLLWYAIPIVGGSMLARPYFSFAMATISSLVITGVGLKEQIIPSPFAMICFYIIALVSWLAARTMERAIQDLRILNVELDQRVQDRTRELAESLAKNQAILDSTADGVIVFDNDNKAVVANPAVTGLLGRPAHGIIGYDIDTLMSENVHPRDQETIVNLLKDTQSAHSGIKFQWGKKTLSASLAPVRDNYDRVTGAVAVFRDFTREAEIDRMKSTFVSIASHELRTPLNAILGYTEMLQEGVYGKLTNRQQGAMERLMSNTGHMLSLVNNLLDRARMEAGTLTLTIGPFSPVQLVEGVKGVMEVMAQAKGLELTSHIADDVPATLSGDWQRLHQILINLVGNAIKFTEEGNVSMRVYMADADYWAMKVSDTGPGISEEAQSYIFEPFRQADESATREYSGAGLGLSIVRQLVEMMGGRIDLESEVEEGSTFTVVLPLEPTVAEGIEVSEVEEGGEPQAKGLPRMTP
jgi:PAS domain S-box-containing protein